jgi:hypothetical protein
MTFLENVRFLKTGQIRRSVPGIALLYIPKKAKFFNPPNFWQRKSG